MDIYSAVEQTVRESYSKLIAYLAVHWRDLTAVEDALADAFVAALETWPRTGIPDKPEAWLLTTARRRLIDGARRARVHFEAISHLTSRVHETQEMDWNVKFPDERLKLLFICAHPAIDPAIHAPLMLQSVLGLDAARIAAQFIGHRPVPLTLIGLHTLDR